MFTLTVNFSSDLLWSHPAERHLYADSLTSTLAVLNSTLCIHHAPGHCHLDAEYVSQGGPYKAMIRSSFPISHLSFKSGLFLIMTSLSEMKNKQFESCLIVQFPLYTSSTPSVFPIGFNVLMELCATACGLYTGSGDSELISLGFCSKSSYPMTYLPNFWMAFAHVPLLH